MKAGLFLQRRLTEEFHQRKIVEARAAALAQQRADIDYIAMMTDVELPDGQEATSDE